MAQICNQEKYYKILKTMVEQHILQVSQGVQDKWQPQNMERLQEHHLIS